MTSTRRTTVAGGAAVAVLAFIALWRLTGHTLPLLQLRIAAVLLGTAAGVICLTRGVALGFSSEGGWKTAAPLMLWAGAMLFLALSLLDEKTTAIGTASALLAAACATGATVLAQKERERARK